MSCNESIYLVLDDSIIFRRAAKIISSLRFCNRVCLSDLLLLQDILPACPAVSPASTVSALESSLYRWMRSGPFFASTAGVRTAEDDPPLGVASIGG